MRQAGQLLSNHIVVETDWNVLHFNLFPLLCDCSTVAKSYECLSPQQCCMRAVVHSAHATNRRTIHKDSSCEPQRVCCLLSHVLHNTVLDLLRSCRWGWLGELLRTRPGLHRSAVFEHQDYMQVILNTWQWWIYICMYIIRIDGVVEAHAMVYIELGWCWAYM